MRLVRFAAEDKTRYGILDNGVVCSLRRSPFVDLARFKRSPTFDGNQYRIKEVKLLAPCQPSKLVCLGLNYHSHASELKFNLPAVPLIFLKPPTAVIGPEDSIVIPRTAQQVDYEGELAVVIGRKAKDIPEFHVADYIMGYTCFNDVTERRDQKDDGQWTRAKGYDTFAPIGPWIETAVDPGNLKLETYLNGKLCQSASTSDLIFPIPRLISFISGIMTLLPGDAIATGTPQGIGKMNPGDIVEVTIENIGTLRNRVIASEQGI